MTVDIVSFPLDINHIEGHMKVTFVHNSSSDECLYRQTDEFKRFGIVCKWSTCGFKSQI